MSGVLVFVGLGGIMATQPWVCVFLLCASDEAIATSFSSTRPAEVRNLTWAQLGCYLLCIAFFAAAQISKVHPPCIRLMYH